MTLAPVERYSIGAMVLHWAIALMIVFNLVTGSFMESLTAGPKHIVVTLHTSTGLTILVLSLVRIGWRLTHRPPPLDAELSPLERFGAYAAHALFYGLMIAMPLIGWSISSASTRKGVVNVYYFLAPQPKIEFLAALPTAQKMAVHDQFVRAHTIGGWIMFGLLILHVAGALKHQFLDGQPQFERMWPGSGSPGRPEGVKLKV